MEVHAVEDEATEYRYECQLDKGFTCGNGGAVRQSFFFFFFEVTDRRSLAPVSVPRPNQLSLRVPSAADVA